MREWREIKNSNTEAERLVEMKTKIHRQIYRKPREKPERLDSVKK